MSHFKNGMSKPNRFEAVFNLPPGVSGLGSGNNFVDPDAFSSRLRSAEQKYNLVGGINIKCHTATLPQRSIRTYVHNQNSAPFEVPYTSAYDPVTLMFYADGNLDTRVYMERWQQTVVNTKSNTLNFYDEFVSDIRIYVLNEADKRTYGIKLEKAWPLSVGAVDWSYSNIDNATTVVATFAYKRWERIMDS